jgi:hypothetical protein
MLFFAFSESDPILGIISARYFVRQSKIELDHPKMWPSLRSVTCFWKALSE